jgi:Fic family protein
MNTPPINAEDSNIPPSKPLPTLPMTVSTVLDAKKSLLFGYDAAKVAEARAKIAIEPDQKRALYVAERSRADFVYNTAALEDNPFTYPEVQTLIDGITVGGHKITDAEQVLRLNQALSHVIGLVKDKSFEFTAKTAKEIQGIVAKNEALTYGVFRNSIVFIGNTTYTVPNFEKLEEIFETGKTALNTVDDPIQKAFLVFLWGSLIQFFHDGNKRTSRFMCNGILMSAGYPPMMITKQEKLEYNKTMSEFYNTQDGTAALVWFYDRYRERIEKFGFESKPQA